MYLTAEVAEQQEQSFGRTLLKEYAKNIHAIQSVIESNNRLFTAFFFGSMLGNCVGEKQPVRSTFIFGPALVYTLLLLTDLGVGILDLPYTALGQESFAQDHPYVAKSLVGGFAVTLAMHALTEQPLKLGQFVIWPMFIALALANINMLRTIINIPYYGVYYGLEGTQKLLDAIEPLGAKYHGKEE